MLEIRHANQRGSADFGWLKSRHSFSFGSYYDPSQMGFSALRVINDDIVTPGAGFDTHGHKDMEILSLVLQGSIAHKDSAGNTEVLPAGEYQLMSAGRGIYHSEFNASEQDMLRFLQIWLLPDRSGEAPGYQQKYFGEHNGLTLILSPDGRDGSLKLKQNALLYQLILPANEQLQLPLQRQRNAYVHLISGELKLNGQHLRPGDGAKVKEEQALQMSAVGAVKALIFDLP